MARDVVLVNGLPGSGKSTLGPALASGLGAEFLSKDRIKEALAGAIGVVPPGLGVVAMETVWALAARIPGAVVVDSWWFRPRDLEHARAGLLGAGAAAAVEVWCDVPSEVARARYVARRRAAVHADAQRLATDWADWAARGEPLALGPVLRVDTTRRVDLPALCADVRRALGPTPL
ncbi:putative kinase [Krasilnikovia cinnamomea]|uniref:Putative kinase n=1 Tax=Krasilnikovia cinnamomea TaxID=349313 RepID=A0A4Q7ZJ13_9ACTN|nr:AAA family ATPase [Krasilnikovia cinnamomea]RZU50119.1 putative kinase [Krasilnikovia cinnamomea]